MKENLQKFEVSIFKATRKVSLTLRWRGCRLVRLLYRTVPKRTTKYPHYESQNIISALLKSVYVITLLQ